MKTKSNKKILRNPWFYISLVLVVVILIFLVGSISLSRTQKKIVEAPSLQGSSENVEVSIYDDAVLGNIDAPVTIIEFSDYECPFCARFYLNTLPDLKEKYIDTGKAKLVYRDFPLNFHQNAQKAAEATEVARELGGDEKFWEMHDKIFENQQSISAGDLIKYAEEIGLDKSKFESFLDSGKYQSEVQKDFQDGQKAGVQGTPTFFINGKALVGAQPFEAFEQIIEQELSK